MTYENLMVERRGHVAVVTFNRPQKANALNTPLIEEIEQVALSFRDDVRTRVVIFTGAGRHFSSGADLSSGETPHDSLVMRRRRIRIGERAIRALTGMDQITIAAMKGATMGGGACLATALDFRIGTQDCFMSYPEILIGVNLMWQSLPLCVHLVGPARAKRMVISGQWVYGPTLLEWGALDEMVESEHDLMPKAFEWAELYASRAPLPAQMIKRSVNAISSALDQAIMHMDFDQNALVSGSEDAETARTSYLAKQEPHFRGN
ncbi:MAG: enoyl-CoA hydratase/isomerase family protein [bacterium]|nr:enoyl-CoA hydratase/isomerase family protein [bacterium]